MSGRVATEPVGSVDIALARSLELLNQDAALALEQAQEILRVSPGHPIATLAVAMAQRRLGKLPEALATLETLARSQPTAGAVYYEYGLALAAAGRNVDKLTVDDLAPADHFHSGGKTATDRLARLACCSSM